MSHLPRETDFYRSPEAPRRKPKCQRYCRNEAAAFSNLPVTISHFSPPWLVVALIFDENTDDGRPSCVGFNVVYDNIIMVYSRFSSSLLLLWLRVNRPTRRPAHVPASWFSRGRSRGEARKIAISVGSFRSELEFSGDREKKNESAGGLREHYAFFAKSRTPPQPFPSFGSW